MRDRVTVTTQISKDHARIEELLTRAVRLAAGDRTRRSLVDEAADRFLRHAQLEERYLFPAVCEYLPGGVAMVLKQTRDRERIERTIGWLALADGRDDEYAELVEELFIAIGAHIVDQDAMLLPMLTAACPPDVVRRLGEQIHDGRQQPSAASMGETR